jgi:hypothetical protein
MWLATNNIPYLIGTKITISIFVKNKRHAPTPANFANDFAQPLTTFTAWTHRKNIFAGMHICHILALFTHKAFRT